MIGLLVFLCVLGVLIIVHEFGHFIVAKKLGVRVQEFSIGFGPQLLGWRRKDTLYRISLVPLGGYVKLAGDTPDESAGSADEFLVQPVRTRAAIVVCGPVLNYILGVVCFWVIFFAGYPVLTAQVGKVMDGFGAQQAGIYAGDTIVAVDGKATDLWEDVQGAIQSRADSSQVMLSIVRNGQKLELPVPLKAKEFRDVLGKTRTVKLIGIEPSDVTVMRRHGPIASIALSVRKTWDITWLTLNAIGRMVTGQLSLKESVTGPLGIYYITSKAAAIGFTAVLQLVAVLSVSLALFNVLPFPVLDGGHLLFMAIEKVRGKPLNPKVETMITRVAVALLISFALIVTYYDFIKFFGAHLTKIFRK